MEGLVGEGERSRSGAPDGRPEGGREVRWNARRKEEVILRLLRGEGLDALGPADDDIIVATKLAADGTVDVQRALSNNHGFAEFPRVAVNEAGDVAYAWTRSGRVDPAIGPLGAITTLGAAGQGASDARVAIDGDGNAMFAWTRSDGTDSRVQSVRLPAAGVLDPVQTLSDAGQCASDPQLAMDRAVPPRSPGAVGMARCSAFT
jgi:hypothetical protein